MSDPLCAELIVLQIPLRLLACISDGFGPPLASERLSARTLDNESRKDV